MSTDMTSSLLRPRSLSAAIEQLGQLGQAGKDARPLAGGTDLMVELRSGRQQAAVIVDLSALPELRSIEVEGEGLRIGSAVSCARLIASPDVCQRIPMLARACNEVGARQIQARATLGGNLGTASPASDLIPVLFAMDARVRLAGPAGLREMGVTDFIRGYRSTAREPDELIESVLFSSALAPTAWAWRKVGTRAAQSIAKVVACIAIRMENGRIASLRAAAGSVAAQCITLSTLAGMLEGEVPTPELLHNAARAAALQDARPMDDVRATAHYRQLVLARILERMLIECCPMETQS